MAAAEVGAGGRVVGVDRAALDPPLDAANVCALEGDLTDPALPERLLEALGGPADVLLCDAAPKLTGIRATDRANEEALLLAVEALLAPLLRPGGHAVVKLLDGPEAQEIARGLQPRFAKGRIAKLRATRKGSTERYWLGRDFRG